MNRITNNDLKHLIDKLNSVTNSPSEPYSQTVLPDGTTKFTSNLGNYHIDSAYAALNLYVYVMTVAIYVTFYPLVIQLNAHCLMPYNVILRALNVLKMQG